MRIANKSKYCLRVKAIAFDWTEREVQEGEGEIFKLV